MTRYTLRALAAQWRIWSATVAVLALAAVLVDVCLTHRFAVTRPEVVAAARAVGVGPAELEASGTSIYVYSAFTAIPVVAIVGRSCVQALRTNWAGWRLAGASPRQVLVGVVTTVAVLGLVACAPGVLVASAVDQPFSSVLTRMASARMGRIEVAATPALPCWGRSGRRSTPCAPRRSRRSAAPRRPPPGPGGAWARSAGP